MRINYKFLKEEYNINIEYIEKDVYMLEFNTYENTPETVLEYKLGSVDDCIEFARDYMTDINPTFVEVFDELPEFDTLVTTLRG